MGAKAKAKLYGKKSRNRDLAGAFGTLTLSDDNRSPLAERLGNVPETLPHPLKLHESKTQKSKILDVPSTQKAPLAKVAHQVTSRTTDEVPSKISERKLRSTVKATVKIIDDKSTEEDTYMNPLTAISDVESVMQHFNQWAETMEKLLDIVMVGDGSYANVFRLSSKSSPHDYSIAKLIPLRSRRGPGSRSPDLTTVENAANEIRMLAKMSGVKGFTDFKRAMLLRGQLPISFRNACKAFDQKLLEKKSMTESGRRTRRINYPKQQVWLFVEMGDAGEELENILLKGLRNRQLKYSGKSGAAHLKVQQARDIFFSTVEALALGEREARFEHRDLHLSNVCLQPLERDASAGDLDDDWQLVPRLSGFAVTLIDYTLSRADINNGIVFNPMDDKELFCGEGNFQYDIYRYMRQAIDDRGTLDWSAFVPRTNVMWLHYVLVQLLKNTALIEVPHSHADEEIMLMKLLQNIAENTKPDRDTTSKYTSAEDVLVEMEDQSNIEVDMFPALRDHPSRTQLKATDYPPR